MKAKKSVSMKAVVVLMALVLLIGCGVGGTLAWLMDKTEAVTNTFTVGDINIDLNEHTLNKDGTPTTTTTKENSTDYKILPGTSQAKDPFVTVKKDSEACWVFVKIVEKDNYLFTADGSGNKTYTENKYIQWGIDTTAGWELVSRDHAEPSGAQTVTYIYGKKQDAVFANTDINILKDKTVKYASSLTKDDLDALGETKPVLEFTAYAIQSEGLKENEADTDDISTAVEAWTVSGFGSTT